MAHEKKKSRPLRGMGLAARLMEVVTLSSGFNTCTSQGSPEKQNYWNIYKHTWKEIVMNCLMKLWRLTKLRTAKDSGLLISIHGSKVFLRRIQCFCCSVGEDNST